MVIPLISNKKNLFKEIFKVAVGIILIIVLLTRIDFPKLIEVLRTSIYRDVLLASLVFGLSGICQGGRFYILIKKYGFQLLSVMNVFFITMFFNNLSTVMVGDGYKVVFLRQRISNWKLPIATVFLERIIGLSVVLLLGLFYLIFYHPKIIKVIELLDIKSKINFASFMIFAVLLTAGFLIFLRKRIKKMYYHLIKFLYEIKNILSGLSPINLFLLLILTLISHLFVALNIFLLVRSFHANMFFVDSIFVILLVFISSYLPISIGSLGIREGVIFLGLTYLGIGQPIATTVAFSSRIIIYFYAILGGILFLFTKKKRINVSEEIKTLNPSST
jgi:uncharacterized protein (TIRG00374 family)